MNTLVKSVALPARDLVAAAVVKVRGRRLTDLQYLLALRLAAEHLEGEQYPAVTSPSVITQAVEVVTEAVADEFEAHDPRFDRDQFFTLARYGVVPVMEDDPLFVWSWS